jgi:hypothetical protein
MLEITARNRELRPVRPQSATSSRIRGLRCGYALAIAVAARDSSTQTDNC